jgi:Flp pilus assembly protein TadG
MIGPIGHKAVKARTLMGRLRSDVRGNTLAIMAIALIPMCALAGSGVDTARMYVVKVRLQQACDAGVLAGRKAMQTEGSLNTAAANQAKTFFANNFNSGFMGTPTYSTATNPYPFVPVQTADNQVAGTATTTVPMTIMKMFGAAPVKMTVTCQARYDTADTDVMFVLDTTGSMACVSPITSCNSAVSYTRPDGTTGYKVTESSGSKIQGLRDAVLKFYDTVAASADPSTQIRYGFVTYTSTVNAGAAITALSPSYIVDSWPYQSRRVIGDLNNGSSSNSTYTKISSSDCNAKIGRSPATGYNTDGTATVFTLSSYTTQTGNGAPGTCVIKGQPVKPNWRYQQVTFDTSQYKLGTAVADPSKITGATSKWQGCIEERDTTATSSFNAASLPKDLDPDLVPADNSSRWRPMWQDVVYYRGNNSTLDSTGSGGNNSSNPYGDSTSNSQLGAYTPLTMVGNIASGYVSCGKPVQRLDVLTRAQVSAYVNATDFVPQGGTYHDTGMIWGTRLISPTGLWKQDTAARAGHNEPNRYIVFMTDGDMAPNACLYGMYGIENYDQRVTGGSYASNCSNGNDEDYHNARFLAECAAAKARGITVFVVGFGQTLTTQLTTCASPGQAYYASDNASLTAAFQKIATQVALLRISQ